MLAFRKRFLQPTLFASLLLLTLTGCANLTPTRATDVSPAVGGACLAFGVMNYDRLNDTLPTIEEIKSHNAAYRKLCGG